MIAREGYRFYYDLLNVRYLLGGRDPADGLDCIGVAMELLRRARGSVPFEAFPSSRTYSNDLVAAKSLSANDWWDRIGDRPGSAKQIGDVIVTLHPPNYVPHVTVLAGSREPRVVLSTRPNRGVYAVPLARVSSWGECAGVYRLRSAAP
jgi:hypothetical protein